LGCAREEKKEVPERGEGLRERKIDSLEVRAGGNPHRSQGYTYLISIGDEGKGLCSSLRVHQKKRHPRGNLCLSFHRLGAKIKSNNKKGERRPLVPVRQTAKELPRIKAKEDRNQCPQEHNKGLGKTVRYDWKSLLIESMGEVGEGQRL